MPELSPQAQAVLDAALQYEVNPECYSREIAAAALEAVADQVVPYEEAPDLVPAHGQETFLRRLDLERLDQRQHTRTQILAIAAELRGDTTTENNQ